MQSLMIKAWKPAFDEVNYIHVMELSFADG
jgi:hypothetical protein